MIFRRKPRPKMRQVSHGPGPKVFAPVPETTTPPPPPPVPDRSGVDWKARAEQAEKAFGEATALITETTANLLIAKQREAALLLDLQMLVGGNFTSIDAALDELTRAFTQTHRERDQARSGARKAEERAERADNLTVELADTRANERRLQSELTEMRAEADRNRELGARAEKAEQERDQARADLKTSREATKRWEEAAVKAERERDHDRQAIREYAERIAKSGNHVYRKAGRRLLEILDGGR